MHSRFLAATAASIALCVGLTPMLAQEQPAAKRDRAELQAPQMRVQDVPPRLKQILENWERASGKIQKLEGKHSRFVYENTFGTTKQSEGHFYFEAPDKGRIDIEPAKLPPNAKAPRVHPVTKQPYDLSPADHAEIWIADGQNVLQILPGAKTATLFEIPQQQRGKNVIYTELPFLFGLPAKDALERFDFTLVSEDFGVKRDQIHLLVKPRWESDAANWKQASILLNKETYLPSAVELTDPAGSMITVFSFEEFRVNQKPFLKIFQRNPFKYDLAHYQVQVHSAGPQQAGAAGTPGAAGQPSALESNANPAIQPPGGPAGQQKQMLAAAEVPSVVGLPFQEASDALTKRGFKVELKQGSLARNAKDLFTVEEQRQVGETVFLFLYDKPRAATANKPESRTTAKPKTNAVQ
jgi:TIGR03009 family protein